MSTTTQPASSPYKKTFGSIARWQRLTGQDR